MLPISKDDVQRWRVEVESAEELLPTLRKEGSREYNHKD